MSERVNRETQSPYAQLDGTIVNGDLPQPNLAWRGAWTYCLKNFDYAAAEFIVSRNLVTDECAANAHDDCPLDEACKCPHHSARQETA